MRLEPLHVLDGDELRKDARVWSEIGRFGHGVGDHGLRAVGEDGGCDARRGGEGFERGCDVGEGGEGVVGFHQAVDGGLREGDGGVGEGVDEGGFGCFGEGLELVCGRGTLHKLRSFWGRGGGGHGRGGGVVLMLLRRQVYSNWYLRATVAMVCAFSSPKCLDSSLAMDSVERRVP